MITSSTHNHKILLAITAMMLCSLLYCKQEQAIITQPPQLLVHVQKAQKDLAAAIKTGNEIEGKKLYDARLNRIKQYYRNGEYQADIERVCAEAEEHFAHIKPHNSLIIFDIDDTAVVSYTKTDNFCFLWDSKEQCDNMRKELTSTPIKPVLQLYNFVKKLGYKTVFLSSLRSFEIRLTLSSPIQFNREKIENRLAHAGYTGYGDIILKNAFGTSNTAEWKLKERKQLADHYFIAGCVGDRWQDFEGGYTGYKVKLPNYLY